MEAHLLRVESLYLLVNLRYGVPMYHVPLEAEFESQQKRIYICVCVYTYICIYLLGVESVRLARSGAPRATGALPGGCLRNGHHYQRVHPDLCVVDLRIEKR